MEFPEPNGRKKFKKHCIRDMFPEPKIVEDAYMVDTIKMIDDDFSVKQKKVFNIYVKDDECYVRCSDFLAMCSGTCDDKSRFLIPISDFLLSVIESSCYDICYIDLDCNKDIKKCNGGAYLRACDVFKRVRK